MLTASYFLPAKVMQNSSRKFEELVFCDLWFPDSGFRCLIPDSRFRFRIPVPGFRVAPGKAIKTVKSSHYGMMTTVKSPTYARPSPPPA